MKDILEIFKIILSNKFFKHILSLFYQQIKRCVFFLFNSRSTHSKMFLLLLYQSQLTLKPMKRMEELNPAPESCERSAPTDLALEMTKKENGEVDWEAALQFDRRSGQTRKMA